MQQLAVIVLLFFSASYRRNSPVVSGHAGLRDPSGGEPRAAALGRRQAGAPWYSLTGFELCSEVDSLDSAFRLIGSGSPNADPVRLAVPL